MVALYGESVFPPPVNQLAQPNAFPTGLFDMKRIFIPIGFVVIQYLSFAYGLKVNVNLSGSIAIPWSSSQQAIPWLKT
jgi:hypothetical protein